MRKTGEYESKEDFVSVATGLTLFLFLPSFVFGGLLHGIVISWACFTLILSHKFLRLWGNYGETPKSGIESIAFYKNGELNVKGKIVFTIITFAVFFSTIEAFIQFDKLDR